MPSDEPLAYFLTWTTYGTWLPGDERGWVAKPGVFRLADPELERSARRLMTEPEFRLDDEQRRIVEKTVSDHCRIRNWRLHIVNARTNHIHVVVTASGRHPDDVLDQFKAWCTRKLKEHARKTMTADQTMRENWWTQNGSKRQLFTDEAVEQAIVYVRDCQD